VLENLAIKGSVLLAEGEPGMIIGPISKGLGIVYNGVFNFIYNMNEAHALGIAIIIFTIIVKAFLSPLSYKQQKSTFEMQKLQPEMEKIKKKYEKKKDRESQQKQALELQKLQKDNNVNAFGGCLPLLVQLPILYALFHIFQQAYMYIDVVAINYNQIAEFFLEMPEAFRVGLLTQPILDHKLTLDVAIQQDLVKLVNQLTASDWKAMIANSGEYANGLTGLLAEKETLEQFIGINLIQRPGFGFPGIIIPLVAGATTFLSSKVMMKNTSGTPGASAEGAMGQAMQSMKMMNYTMPIMMAVMCVSLPAGVGLYWTISNIIQVIQMVALSKYFKSKRDKEEVFVQ